MSSHSMQPSVSGSANRSAAEEVRLVSVLSAHSARSGAPVATRLNRSQLRIWPVDTRSDSGWAVPRTASRAARLGRCWTS
jgi:hypothetical protein